MGTRITGISSMATRGLLAELAPAWRHDGVEIAFEAVGGVDAARRVREGEAFDVVVLAADAIGTLAAAGCVVRGSEAPLVRSPVAIAVRDGAARPGVETEDALRAAVLAARAIGYSTGPSGVALLELFRRWGIAGTLRDRLVQAPAGVPVGALIARGDVDLGFQQLSELMHADGIAVIGTMPAPVEITTIFSGAVCAASRHPEPAREFLAFARSQATADAKRRHGMQPA
jgi:molybdate transport system substrate-binding protein